MNGDMHDRIIDKFLNGEMKPSEEQEFRMLLDLDPELRTLMQADAVLRDGVRKDAEALPEESPKVYTHFLGLLAATAPAGGGIAAGGSAGKSAAGLTAGAKGSLTATIAGSALMKTMVAVIGAAGLAIGTYLAVPAGDADRTEEGGTTNRIEVRMEAPASKGLPAVATPGAEPPAGGMTTGSSPASTRSGDGGSSDLQVGRSPADADRGMKHVSNGYTAEPAASVSNSDISNAETSKPMGTSTNEMRQSSQGTTVKPELDAPASREASVIDPSDRINPPATAAAPGKRVKSNTVHTKLKISLPGKK